MISKQSIQAVLSQMSIEDLQRLVSEAERILGVRQFEEEMRKAVIEYQQRDPRVIRV